MGPEEAFHWASQNFNSIILETYKWAFGVIIWALWGYYLGFLQKRGPLVMILLDKNLKISYFKLLTMNIYVIFEFHKIIPI